MGAKNRLIEATLVFLAVQGRRLLLELSARGAYLRHRYGTLPIENFWEIEAIMNTKDEHLMRIIAICGPRPHKKWDAICGRSPHKNWDAIFAADGRNALANGVPFLRPKAALDSGTQFLLIYFVVKNPKILKNIGMYQTYWRILENKIKTSFEVLKRFSG